MENFILNYNRLSIKSKTTKLQCNIGKPQADEKEFIPVKLATSGNPKVKNRHVFFRGRRYTFRKSTYIIRTFS